MRNAHPYAACFVVRVRLSQMNVMVAFLTLYEKDAEDALTMDFGTVLSATTSHAVMNAGSFPAKSSKSLAQNLLSMGFAIMQM